MSTPRCIRAGTTWFVTRRTTRRHFLLRPDEDGKLQDLYWYTTAVIAAETGIELHAVQVLSTHIHEVLTDTRGELPRFLQQRNRLLANAVKCHRHWPEEVFARAPTSCVALCGAAAIEKEIGYTLANCVEAGLVARPEDWPGVTITPDGLGRAVIRAERPAVYFDPNNPRWPAVVELRVTLPEALERTHGSRCEALGALRRVVDAAISTARAAAEQARRFVGALVDLVRTPFDRRATSREPFGNRFPTFAAGGDSNAAHDALLDRRTFLSKYRSALEALRRRAEALPFPYGTWRICEEFGAPREPPPDGPTQRRSEPDGEGDDASTEGASAGGLIFESRRPARTAHSPPAPAR